MSRKNKFDVKVDLDTNSVFWGDCKDWLKYISKESVDVIYIDPPFFTGKEQIIETDQNILKINRKVKKHDSLSWGNGYETRAFNDSHEEGINGYKDWIITRLKIARELLKQSGSIFLHCDSNANYKLREALNEVFGEDQFTNEIFWKSTNSTKSQSKTLGNQMNTIFHYSKKKEKQKLFKIFRERTDDEIKKDFLYDEEKKRYYRTQPLMAYGSYKHNKRPFFEYKGIKGYWISNKERIQALNKEGRLSISGKTARRIEYPEDTKGVNLGNLWTDITIIKKELRIEYPTQKPVRLIKRILEMSSEKGDIVLDFFGGGGTTAIAAYEMNRKFIIGDVSPVAVTVTLDQLNRIKKENINFHFDKKLIPATRLEWQGDIINGLHFSKQICNLMGWEWIDGAGDGGIDGWAKKRTIPVQIKNYNQSKKVSPNEIRAFAGAMKLVGKKFGLFVGWDFSHQAKITIREFKEKGIEIKRVFVDELIAPLILEKEREYYRKLYKESVKESKQEKPRFDHVS